MKPSHRLGDLQLAILKVLWDRQEATVAEVHQALLPTRGLALTTIATMLSKMEAKGVVDHRKDGRQFVYRPVVAEDEVHRSMVSYLTERLFEGDPVALVNHLLTQQEIQPDELAEIKRLIEHREGDDDDR